MDKVTGSKEARANPFAAYVQNDKVLLIAGIKPTRRPPLLSRGRGCVFAAWDYARARTAVNVYRNYEVGIEQEPGSGGKESAENTVRNLVGYAVAAR